MIEDNTNCITVISKWILVIFTMEELIKRKTSQHSMKNYQLSIINCELKPRQLLNLCPIVVPAI
jgi:hypothetical protein